MKGTAGDAAVAAGDVADPRPPDVPLPVTLRIATYNVHRCRGLDGRTRPERVARVLEAIAPDVIALQEVLGDGPRFPSQLAELARAFGMHWVMAPNRWHRGHLLGNAVLSRFPIVHHDSVDLSHIWYSRRNCLLAEIAVGGIHRLHLFNVHLGTGFFERRHQARRLESFINHDRTRSPKVVLGDFNELPRGEATRMLLRSLKAIDLLPHLRRGVTYPGIMPFVHIDHIYYQGNVELLAVKVPRSRSALMASDHLPLAAQLRIIA